MNRHDREAQARSHAYLRRPEDGTGLERQRPRENVATGAADVLALVGRFEDQYLLPLFSRELELHDRVGPSGKRSARHYPRGLPAHELPV